MIANLSGVGIVTDLLIARDGTVEQVVMRGEGENGATSYIPWADLGWNPDGQHFVLR